MVVEGITIAIINKGAEFLFLRRTYFMLEANRRVLEDKRYKGLLKKIEETNKDYNVKYNPDEDKLFYKNIELDKVAEIKEENIRSYDFIILHGFGKGKAIRALRGKFKKTMIIVLEKNINILKEVLENKDLSDIFVDENILVMPITENYREEIDKLLTIFGPKLMWAEVYQYYTDGYDRVDFYEAEEIKSHVSRFLTTFFLNRSTLIHQSETVVENAIKNMAVFARGGPLSRFIKNKFEGKPAVIVASGPSLMKNIDTLSKIKDKALIIAVDSVLGTLYKKGIKPDIVCGVDYTPLNLEKYKPILKEKKKSDLIYVHTVSVYHEIPKLFEKTVAECYSNSFTNLYIDIFGKIEDLVLPGNANTHFAIAIAYYLRTNPIIFVGQDWAFSGGVDHAKGASVEVNIPGKIYWVKGSVEKKVPTDTAMYTGLKVVEDIIKTLSRKGYKFINATEGGAYIEGAEHITLEEAKDRYLKEVIDKSAFSIDCSVNYDSLIKKTQEIVGRIEWIIKKSNDTLKLVNEVLDKWLATKNEREILKKVEKINEINNKITYDSIFIGAVQSFFFKDFYYFNREEIDIEGQEVEQRIRQSIRYFKLIKEKSMTAYKLVKKMLNMLKLEREFRTNEEKFLKSENKILSLIELYFDFKDIYIGLELVEKAIKRHGEKAELFFWKGKLQTLNRFMHKEALESFKKALEIEPDFKKAEFEYGVEKNIVSSHLILAKQAIDRKDYVGAKRLVSRALDYEPENEEVKRWLDTVEEMAKVSKDYQRQKLLYEQLNLEGEVFEEYKKAIEFVKHEKFENAYGKLLSLYDKYGNFGDIPFLLGSILIDKKELDKAEKYLKEAVELIPYQPLVYLALGKLYIEKEDYVAAKENLERAISMSPDLKPGVLDTLGNLYYEFGEYEKAFKAFEEYLQYSDDRIKTLTKLALCYKEMGMINEYNMLMEKIKSITAAN